MTTAAVMLLAACAGAWWAAHTAASSAARAEAAARQLHAEVLQLRADLDTAEARIADLCGCGFLQRVRGAKAKLAATVPEAP